MTISFPPHPGALQYILPVPLFPASPGPEEEIAQEQGKQVGAQIDQEHGGERHTGPS